MQKHDCDLAKSCSLAAFVFFLGQRIPKFQKANTGTLPKLYFYPRLPTLSRCHSHAMHSIYLTVFRILALKSAYRNESVQSLHVLKYYPMLCSEVSVFLLARQHTVPCLAPAFLKDMYITWMFEDARTLQEFLSMESGVPANLVRTAWIQFLPPPSTKRASCFPPSRMPASIEIQ